MQYSVITDYTPSCSLNEFIQTKYNTGNSHEYRYFLQKNSNDLRKIFLDCADKEIKYAKKYYDARIQ